MPELYVITGLALRFPTLLDYRVQQFVKIVPALGEAMALEEAQRELAALAPAAQGWEGHTVRAVSLEVLQPAER